MNTLSGLLIISCLFLLGASRLRVSIRMMAAQGMLLGLLPFTRATEASHSTILFIGLGGFILKGLVLPWFLSFVLRRSAIRREIEPLIGFNTSILMGIGLLGLACWVALRMKEVGGDFEPVLLAAALYMALTGLFLIVTRRKAITQALGYLVMENGIYALGVSIGHELHAIVEIGVLLDVFVGVFLMGILMFHINREFDHIDADRFTDLRDLLDRPKKRKEEVQ